MKKHAQMSTEQRAKQFLPFAGVKGLDEALALQDEFQSLETEVFLADEEKEKIGKQVAELQTGESVWVEYTEKKQLILKKVLIREIDWDKGLLFLAQDKLNDSLCLSIDSLRRIYKDEL